MDDPTFTWGTCASGVGAEGASDRSDWGGWEAEGRAPSSSDGNGFPTRFRDDAAVLADHDVPSHRLTLEWARLEPHDGHRDEQAVRHYRTVLEAFRDAGVAVWACLHHLALPGWFTDDNHGFRDEDMARRRWPAHVDWAAETFGDLVTGWVPMHEPTTYARLAFGDGLVPPGRADPTDHHRARRLVLEANRTAARLLHDGRTPVMSAHPIDWLDRDELLRDREVFDLTGLTSPADDGAELLRGLDRLQERLEGHPGPLALAAVGIGTDDEDRRVGVVRGTVAQVHEARDAGLDLRGLWWRTFADGYEWHQGFGPRWGLFDRDRNPRAALPFLVDGLAPLLPPVEGPEPDAPDGDEAGAGDLGAGQAGAGDLGRGDLGAGDRIGHGGERPAGHPPAR